MKPVGYVRRNRATLINTSLFSPKKSLQEQVVLSPNGKYVATASDDGTARIWETDNGINVAELRGHSAIITSIQFSSDSKFVLTASTDGTARIWDIKGGMIAVLRGHTGRLTSASFSPDDAFVVTTSADGTTRLWHAFTKSNEIVLRGHSAPINFAAFSPDAKSIVTVSEDKTARIWGSNAGNLIVELSAHTKEVNSVAFNPDGTLIATASSDGTVCIWDKNGKLISKVFVSTEKVINVGFNSYGKQVITLSDNGIARVWDVESARMLSESQGPIKWVVQSRFSPVPEFLVSTGFFESGVWVWEARTGDVKYNLQAEWIAFSPNLKYYARIASTEETVARVYNAKTGNIPVEVRGHTDGLLDVVFSPNDDLVLTVSKDQSVRVWESRTGFELMMLRIDRAISATFAPDGKSIVTTGGDGMARIYTCDMCGDVEELLALARTHVTRQLTCEERNTYLHENLICPTPSPTRTPTSVPMQTPTPKP